MTRDEFEKLLEVNSIAFVGEAAWRVAQLVAAHEREACAKVCYEYAQNAFNNSSQNAAMELRDMIRSGAKHDTRV